jgi:predicted anti-sigma-YlaC factor YlaD
MSMLSAYIDGEVQTSDAEMIESHLGECNPCASEWKALQAMTGMLRTTPEVEPPAFLLAQIEAATVNRTGFLTRVKRAFDHVPTAVRWASAPIAAAIVLLGILLSNNGSVQTPIAVNNPTERIEKSVPGLPNATVEEQVATRPNAIAGRPKVRTTGWRFHGGKAIADAKRVGNSKRSVPGEVKVANADGTPVVEEPKLEEPVVPTEVVENTPLEPAIDVVPTSAVTEASKAGKVSLAKSVAKAVVLDEPGAIEQLRARLAAKNKSKLNNHEGVDGRKYSVGLISLRF